MFKLLKKKENEEPTGVTSPFQGIIAVGYRRGGAGGGGGVATCWAERHINSQNKNREDQESKKQDNNTAVG